MTWAAFEEGRTWGKEPPLATLKCLAFAPWTPDREDFLRQFSPIRLPQHGWADQLIEAVEQTAGDLADFSFASLDRLALGGNAAPLAALLQYVNPREVQSTWGDEPLLWAWLNRTTTGELVHFADHTPVPGASRAPAQADRLSAYLEIERDYDLALLGSVARASFDRLSVVNADAVMKVYWDAAEHIGRQTTKALDGVKLPDLQVNPEPVLVLRRLYQALRAEVSLVEQERSKFERLFALLPAHAPVSFALADIEAMTREGKNIRPFHSLVTLLPPELLEREIGAQAKDLLLWAAVNFTSSASSSIHHTAGGSESWDWRYKRITRYLEDKHSINYEFFHQAQMTAWYLCNGSTDVGLVLKNYELFEHMRNFDPKDIPVASILERYRVGEFPREPERYSVCAVEVMSRKVEGADVRWLEREEAWDWGKQDKRWLKSAERERRVRRGPPIDIHYNWRRFGQTVRCDSPRGLALTHDGYPIAIISFHVGPGEKGGYELVCSTMQGVRIELWRGRQFQTFPTPNSLGPKYLQVLTEMMMPIAASMGMPWVHQGPDKSNWRDKFSPRRFENRLHDLELAGGQRLQKDSRGNWRLD